MARKAVRRATDKSIPEMEADVKHLHDCVEAVKLELQRNSALTQRAVDATQEVRDILASFKIIAAVAKWAAVVGSGFLAAYHGWQKLTGR